MLRRFLAISCLTVLLAGCTAVDHSAKINTLQKKASKGEAISQFQLGAAYDQGLGVTQNRTTAEKWYKAAAEQGHAEAQNSLGSMYQAGDGVPQDNAQAFTWYQKAAKQGHARAKNNLAYMYDLGLGTSEDNQTAAQLYKEAAESGEIRGMLNLGVLLVQGQSGVEKDLVEAYKWLDLARFYTQGSKDMKLKWRARGALDELSTMMTPAQIKEAKKRASAWDQAHRSK